MGLAEYGNDYLMLERTKFNKFKLDCKEKWDWTLSAIAFCLPKKYVFSLKKKNFIWRLADSFQNGSPTNNICVWIHTMLAHNYPGVHKCYGHWWSHPCLRSGLFILIWVNVCLKMLAFLHILANCTTWLFRQNVSSFKQEIPFILCFWLFWPLYFHNFAQILFESLFFFH